MKQKLFTLLLAVAASVGTLFAESGTCGANLTWVLTNGVLTISGTGDMTNYEKASQVPWYSSRSSITSVTIGNSVTSIGRVAFCGCTGLTSVTIGNSVTSILDYAFYECTGLTSVTIPNSVTSIGNYAFQKCTGLTSMTIPNSVTSIGDVAFYGCTGLTSVTIPNSVTSIGQSAFAGCTGLTSVTIPNSVTSIVYSAFAGCTGLTSVTIPNSVTSIGDCAFCDCTSLTSVTIPNSVTSFGDLAFADCTGLTSVTIGNSVTNIGYQTFNGCTSLISVTIGNSVTGIGDWAFAGCSSLTSVTIPNSVTSIGMEAFSHCTGLTSVTIGNSVTSIGWYAFLGCTGLTSVTIPNSVTSIGWAAFGSCTGLTSVTIGNSVTSIGPDTFNGCTALTSVTMGNSLTSIGNYAFEGCTGLTSVTIPNSVTSIGKDAFEGCTGLTSVTIGSSVTSIGDEAFSGCTDLTSITCWATTPPGVSSSAFNNVDCSKIRLHVPEQSISNYKHDAQWSKFYVTSTNKYVIIFVDWDNKELQSLEIASGSIPQYSGLTPSRATTAEFTYTFAGWTPEVVPVASDATYKATYNATKNSYTITWQNEDGSLIDQTTVEYGVVPTHPDPSKSATAEHTYTFASWTPEVVAVTGDATYKATFNATKNKYIVIFQNDNGTELKREELEYGVMPVAPADPTKSATAEYTYTFAGWDKTITTVTGDATYKATFTATKNSYTITWLNEDGSLIDKTTVEYGVVPTHADPVKTNTDEYKYIFVGWNPKIVAVTEDATYSAQYNAIPIEQETTATITDNTIVSATQTEEGNVILEWPAVDGADSYTITISKNGELICLLTFDAEGHLISIAFAAPARDGNGRNAATAEQTAKGWRYVVIGLQPNATYTYSVTANNINDDVLFSETIDFTVSVPLGIEDSFIESSDTTQKVLIDGHFYILHNGKMYNIHGAEVK